MRSTDPVLQPLPVGALTLKNRIYSTGHAPSGYLEAGRPGLRYELYHEEKAKGGLALTIIGGSSNVAPDSASVFDQIDAGDRRGPAVLPVDLGPGAPARYGDHGPADPSGPPLEMGRRPLAAGGRAVRGA